MAKVEVSHVFLALKDKDDPPVLVRERRTGEVYEIVSVKLEIIIGGDDETGGDCASRPGTRRSSSSAPTDCPTHGKRQNSA